MHEKTDAENCTGLRAQNQRDPPTCGRTVYRNLNMSSLALFPAVDCAFEWGRFGECSQTCDGGFRVRFPIVSEEPQNGGQPCPPAQQEDCGTTPCPRTLTFTYFLCKLSCHYYNFI